MISSINQQFLVVNYISIKQAYKIVFSTLVKVEHFSNLFTKFAGWLIYLPTFLFVWYTLHYIWHFLWPFLSLSLSLAGHNQVSFLCWKSSLCPSSISTSYVCNATESLQKWKAIEPKTSSINKTLHPSILFYVDFHKICDHINDHTKLYNMSKRHILSLAEVFFLNFYMQHSLFDNDVQPKCDVHK